jgi:soluble lytic murein transglycosylase-like protein
VRRFPSWTLTAALLSAPFAVAQGIDGARCEVPQWQGPIEDAAEEFAVPAAWLAAVMQLESHGCPEWAGRPARSPAGAMGLMQLMPTTWRTWHRRLNLKDDPDDPRENIRAGAAYLRELYERFGAPGCFAAYHAGPARYDAFLRHVRALPPSTISYARHLQALLGNAGVANLQSIDDLDARRSSGHATVFVAHPPERLSPTSRLFVAHPALTRDVR